MYKTTVGNFQSNYELKKGGNKKQNSSGAVNPLTVVPTMNKKNRKSRKEEVIKMINQLELGEN